MWESKTYVEIWIKTHNHHVIACELVLECVVQLLYLARNLLKNKSIYAVSPPPPTLQDPFLYAKRNPT